MEVVLKQVPDWFFNQQQWMEFSSHFDSREIALERLSAPPYGAAGFYRDGDSKLAKTGELRQRQIEELFQLGITLIGDFKTKLIKGQVISTGIPTELHLLGSVERKPIAPDLWKKMWPEFTRDCAWGTIFAFNHVRLRRNDSREAIAAEMLERCTAWLRSRAADGVDRRKILEKEAVAHFGSDLPTRVFSAAYKEVFKKPRGRPRIKNNRQQDR